MTLFLRIVRVAEVAISMLNAEIKNNWISESPLLPPSKPQNLHVIPNEVRNLLYIL